MSTGDFKIYEQTEFAHWLRAYVRPPRGPALADMVEKQRKGMALVMIQLSTLELRTWFRLRGVLQGMWGDHWVDYLPLKRVHYYDVESLFPRIPDDLRLGVVPYEDDTAPEAVLPADPGSCNDT